MGALLLDEKRQTSTASRFIYAKSITTRCKLYQGIDKSEKDNPNFIYDRIDVLLNEDNFIDMDESDPTKIKNFAELASIAFQHNRSSILQKHFY